jgi:hypothetical protein
MVQDITKIANPAPLPSALPDHVLELRVKVDKKPLDATVAQSLRDFQNAACYIAAGESKVQPKLLWRTVRVTFCLASVDFPP